VLGETLFPYLDPDRKLTSLEGDDSWEDLADRCKWVTTNNTEALDELLEDNETPMNMTKFLVGTPAVYRLVSCVYFDEFTVGKAYDYTFVQDAVNMFMQCVEPSTQVTPGALKKAADTSDRTLDNLAHKMESAAEAFKHSRLNVSKIAGKAIRFNQKRFFGEGSRCYHFVSVNNLIFGIGAGTAKTNTLVLSKSNLDQVIGSLTRIANMCRYVSLSHHDEPDILRAFKSMLEYSIVRARAAPQARSYWVARAFHSARSIDFLHVINSIQDISTLVNDHKSERLDGICDLERYMTITRGLKPEARLMVALIYKWMPPPDFDATKSLGVMRDYHTNPRKSGLDETASDEDVEIARQVLIERKMNLAWTFKAKNGKWPDTLTMKRSHPTLAEIIAWDPSGTLVYKPYRKDIVSTVKDKATVPKYKQDYLSARYELTDRSYLLWFMKNRDEVDTEAWLKDYANSDLAESRYVGVAYKPESQKVDSRMFYLAPPKQRVLLSELESNIASIAEFYPGSLMGTGSAARRKVLDTIMDTTVPAADFDAMIDFTTVTITFDLTKFSARAAYSITENYTQFWADVFAIPELASLATIGCKGAVCHAKFGLDMEYQNQGADLEGFRGRLMTLMHVDVLSAATRSARRKGYITGKAVLGAFIDDGGLKVNVVGVGDQFRANLDSLLAEMANTYRAMGQDMNPSKATISLIGGDLLSETYYKGVRIPTGIKAAAKMHPNYENAAASIVEELDTFFAIAQGMVKEGSQWAPAYTMYIEAAIKSILRWSKKQRLNMDLDALAIGMLTPKSFGGFGLQPLQGLVSTNTTTMTAEGLGMMNRLARSKSPISLKVKKMMNKGIVRRDNLSIFRDPLRIRSNTSVLVENRLLMRTMAWLEDKGGELANFSEELKDRSAVTHAKALADVLIIRGQPIVSPPVLARVWKTTPLCYIESILGKFKRSSTIISLMGESVMRSIRKANLRDLEAVLETLSML
jgi:hypothetical protein